MPPGPVPDSAALFAFACEKKGAGATAQTLQRLRRAQKPRGKQKIKFKRNRSSQSGGAGVLRWSLAFRSAGAVRPRF